MYIRQFGSSVKTTTHKRITNSELNTIASKISGLFLNFLSIPRGYHMEERHIDENIRQKASNYSHIPEVEYSEIKRLVVNRNTQKKRGNTNE